MLTRRISLDGIEPEELWIALVAISIADIATTMVGLEAGAPEGNPVVAAAISSFGLWTLVPLKVLMLVVWRAGFRAIPYRWELGMLMGGTAFFAAVVLVNVGVIGTRLGVW